MSLPLEYLREYDGAAEWCARRGLTGKCGDRLPDCLSGPCFAAINEDVEAFQDRVEQFAYALAMERINPAETPAN